MKSNSKIIIFTLIVAALIIGVAYATITAVNLSVSGSATATADQSNFSVKFFGTPTKPSEAGSNVSAEISATNPTQATIKVLGGLLSKKGDYVTVSYPIKNFSDDLSATLAVGSGNVTNSNSEYFKVEPVLAATTLAAGADTTLSVKITLIKTPIDADVSTDLTVTVVASPIQPEA